MIEKRRWKIASVILAVSMLVSAGSFAAKKSTKKKSGPKKAAAQTFGAREKKLLAWSSDYPTAYPINDKADFAVRGAILSFEPVQDSNRTLIRVLPIEVSNNPMHYVTLDHFKTGIPLNLKLDKSQSSGLRPGAMVEYSRTSSQEVAEKVGGALLMKTNEDIKFVPQNAAPASYLSQKGLEPEQLLNAIRGTLLYEGKIDSDNNLKTAVTTLSKNKNQELAGEAKKLSAKLFGK